MIVAGAELGLRCEYHATAKFSHSSTAGPVYTGSGTTRPFKPIGTHRDDKTVVPQFVAFVHGA
jgi:hypothetical protein